MQVDPAVSAAVHNVAALFAKARQDFSGYYRAALQFLCYVSLDDLPQDDQLVLARDISLAALLGDSVYSFAELLLHPVVCFYSPLVVSCSCELLPSDCQQTHLHQDASLQIQENPVLLFRRRYGYLRQGRPDSSPAESDHRIVSVWCCSRTQIIQAQCL